MYIYVRLIMSNYLFFGIIVTSMFGISHAVQKKVLEFTYRVIDEVLVLGLLV